MATLINQSAEQLKNWLANTSDYQIQLFWQRVSQLSDDVLLLRSLFGSLLTSKDSGQISSDAFTSWLKYENALTVLKSFAIVGQLLPPTSVPGILVLLPDDNYKSTTSSLLSALTQLVETSPTIPVGLLLEEKQSQVLLDKVPESRAKAILRGGLIKVPSPQPNKLKEWLSNRGLEDEASLQHIICLTEKYGTSTESLETALNLIDLKNQPNTADADSVFRSQAEKFLFQHLEARSTTVGRFKANARLDIQFSNKNYMEIDFLDAKAKIVVEVDGYYHFRSPEDYRRDRRKDAVLQQHGFLVLRFLAEDVVSNLENIFDTIDQTISLRKSQPINYTEI